MSASYCAHVQVEAYFVDTMGVLFPYYHISYWMGLTSNEGLYPRFTWLDYNTPAPGEAASRRPAADAASKRARTSLRSLLNSCMAAGMLLTHSTPIPC